jgi:hypothetical protein
LLSSSYAPLDGQPGHDAMMLELQRIYRAHSQDGKVAIEYKTRVFYGHL